MSLPKEPRQKMINVMYLVLTALLALNVSKEILNAFKTVNNSLQNTNTVIDSKNSTLFASLKELLSKPESHDSAALWAPKADKAKELADNMYTYIENFKTQLKKDSKLQIVEGKEVFNLDNTDAATRLFVEREGKKTGEELRQKLTDFKSQLLDIDPLIRSTFETSLPLDLSIPESANNKLAQNDWAYAYFHMTPTIAAITILSKFQNDIKNSEAQVVEFCHGRVGKVKIIYDQFKPIISQSSNYLMPGDELTVSGGVGAFSSAAKPTVTINGSPVALDADGMATKKFNVGGTGSDKVRIHITYTKPNGQQGTLDKDVEYTVGSPTGASVSADATKVFYIGLDNPISVSGGSKGDEATNVTIDNGTLNKTAPGKYIVNNLKNGTTDANVNVSVEGKTTPFHFRVKPIPDPLAMVGRSKGGRMPVSEFRAQAGLSAVLENFIFEGVKYNVSSFTLIATGKGFTESFGIAQNSGAAFGADARRIIDRCVSGTTVTFDEIKAVGPDGRARSLPLIGFNLY